MITIFSLLCRLGMANVPYGGKNKLNIGVEDAPHSILSNEFRKTLPEHKVIEIQYTLPEQVQSSEHLDIFAKDTLEAKNTMLMLSKDMDKHITIGGDHSSSLASVLAILERYKEDTVGYIQIDSHADLHMLKTSPSGNIHGMWTRVFMDDFDYKPLARIAQRKILPENALYIGNLVTESAEDEFIEKNNIQVITKKSLANNLSFVEKWISRFDHLHVSFDIDSLDSSIAPATGIPAKDGLTKEQAITLFDILRKHKSLSFDLVEVNPLKEGAEKTIAFAQLLLKKLLV